MPIVINSRACIWSTQRWAPLITQSGPHNLASLMAQLDFRGERNAYEGMESLWKITPSDSTAAESFDYEMWRTHWNENRPTWQQVPWRYPIDKNRPIHEHRVTDFGLNVPKTSAAGNDPQAENSGFRSANLPQIPDPDRPRPRKTRPFFRVLSQFLRGSTPCGFAHRGPPSRHVSHWPTSTVPIVRESRSA